MPWPYFLGYIHSGTRIAIFKNMSKENVCICHYQNRRERKISILKWKWLFLLSLLFKCEYTSWRCIWKIFLRLHILYTPMYRNELNETKRDEAIVQHHSKKIQSFSQRKIHIDRKKKKFLSLTLLRYKHRIWLYAYIDVICTNVCNT